MKTIEIDGNRTTQRTIYYISDLHVLEKLLDAIPAASTESEMREWFYNYVHEMLANTRETPESGDLLLVGGDVSSIIEVAGLFYEELAKQWPGEIVAVLGNHELWHLGRTATVPSVVTDYRELFQHLGIRFLENELLLFTNGDARVLTEWELLTMDAGLICDLLGTSDVAVLGGVGFSGCNDGFNATHGLYREAVSSREDDQDLSARFNAVHARLCDILGVSGLIVLTHTPKSDWSKSGYAPGFTYVSGHTHKNVRHVDAERTVYADNQVGYHGKNRGLKHFRLKDGL